jgi:hypothetical protein
MRNRGITLSRRHERWMYVALGSLYATGMAWMALHYLVNGNEALENGWRIGETWALRAHGAAAMAALLALGSVLAVHVPRAWHLSRNLLSGTAMLATALVLAFTGWLLYYASGESMRAWSDYLHMAIGAAAPIALLWHLRYRALTRTADGRR